MALGDLFRPKHKHSDAAVRADAVRSLGSEDAELLAEIARGDDDPAIRRLALDKLNDPDVLAEIAASEQDPSVRSHARNRAVDRFVSAALSGQGDPDGAILWLASLDEQRPLAQVACRAPSAQHRRRAMEKMSDQRALAEVVREAREQDVALGALARLEDLEVLRSLAMDLDSRDRGAAVVDRIEDESVLAAVAARAKNKGVRSRANKRLQARRSAAGDAGQRAPVLVDSVGWQEQQRIQLVRVVEERAAGDEWVESQREVAAAEEVWGRLGPGEDAELAQRFIGACERYREQLARRAPEAAVPAQSNGSARDARRGEAAVTDTVKMEMKERPPDPAPAAPPAPDREPDMAVRPEAALQHEAEESAGHELGRGHEQGLGPEQRSGAQYRQSGEVRPAGHDKPAAEQRAARATPASEAERNLAALEALSADLERAVAAEHLKLSTAEKKLKQADSKYPTLLVLPSPIKRKAMERFQEARRHLFIKVGELREVEDWKRWANVPKQEELIRLVEGLVEAPDTGNLAQQLKDAQAAWKEVGPAPREKGQELWQRFKTACDKVYERVKQQRAHHSAEQKEHLRLKLDLCARAEELADSEDWGPAAEALKRLQAEWKTIGPVPRKQADEVWKRFRAACDRFFERRRPHVEKALGERQANLERKQALVDQAEALAAAAADVGTDVDVDWDAALREVAELRREWRRVGPIPQRDYEVMSQRFQAACDRVAHGRELARASRQSARRCAVEATLAGAEAAVASGAEGLAEIVLRARAEVRDLEAEAGAAGDLRQRADALCRLAVEQHPAAFKGTDLDPDQIRKRKERIYQRVAELASRAAGSQVAPAEGALTAEQMAAKLRAALAERALGGVLARDTKPIAQVVAEARESWQRLGPLPGEAGEDLERRFAEACRRALRE